MLTSVSGSIRGRPIGLPLRVPCPSPEGTDSTQNRVHLRGGSSEPTQIPTRKDAPTADINEFMAAKEALALAKAFMRIGNEKLRQRCVSLVNELGTEQRSG